MPAANVALARVRVLYLRKSIWLPSQMLKKSAWVAADFFTPETCAKGRAHLVR